LEPIPEEKRRTEADLASELDSARPEVLGAILDAVSAGLRLLPTVRLDRKPRMADFALWGEAVARGLGYEPDRFLAAYQGSISAANPAAREASRGAQAVLAFMAARPRWEGTATELLAELTRQVGDDVARQRNWPRAGNALSAALARTAPALRRAGVRFE